MTILCVVALSWFSGALIIYGDREQLVPLIMVGIALLGIATVLALNG